ncbi:MAG: hypothetical protein VR65_25005 [Desulfobulbaceae bacterium BRH_c16a]|nr:MAG: hypothetical protein VR65_25005 [Desulfobulbaceae bacterium BRH_c16a]
MKFEMVVDPAALDSIISQLPGTEKQVVLARGSALRKTGAWLKTQVKRGVAKELNITQKSIESRFHFNKMDPESDTLKVWIGTSSVSPFAVGNPTILGSPSKPTGIRVRSHSYPGAFIARIYSEQKKVWIRLHSTHYSPELYPVGKSGVSGAGSFPGSKGRFPVVQVTIPIDDTVKRVLETLEEDLGRKYEEIFARELNYQVNVKGATA